MREIPMHGSRPAAPPQHPAFCNSPLMNLIEAYIQFEPGLITDDGEFTVESTRDFLRTYMTEFYGFITRVYTVLPRGGA
jgi:chromate reductase, NAD(P)H dehydrogenase (quinone)